MAILYRTNAQSRVFEESFMIKNIPYRIVGGTNFYQRKEVKDILSYLKVVDNGLDDLAVRRIINVPRRGSVQQQSRRSMCMQLSIILVFRCMLFCG